MGNFSIDFSENSIWFCQQALSCVLSRTILPVVFDILVQSSTHGNVKELSTTTDGENRLFLVNSFLDKGQFEDISLKVVVIAINDFRFTIEFWIDILPTCQDELVNQTDIVASHFLITNRQDDGNSSSVFNSFNKAFC